MGFKVAECRMLIGMTQEELAKKSRVSRTIISGLESGALKTTTTKTLESIARALGVSISDIYFDDEFNLHNTTREVD